MYRIGIDLGGTNIAAGIVDGSRKILRRESVKTNLPTTLERLVGDLAGLVQRLMEGSSLKKEDILSVGVGVPCTANEANGWMEDADHLGFPGGPLVPLLEERLQMPVRFGNDANAAAWGEYQTCGYDAGSFLLVTLGTGVGGGIILNGKLWTGVNYAAGELGHMVIHAGGEQCACGRKGCFEAYGSASALIARAKARMQADPDTILWQICGGDIHRIEAKSVFDGAREQDTACLELLDAYTTCLAEGFANIINIFQPAVLCIGGGVSAAGDLLLSPVREKTMELAFSTASSRSTQIILARLGNDAGIIGAALL